MVQRLFVAALSVPDLRRNMDHASLHKAARISDPMAQGAAALAEGALVREDRKHPGRRCAD